MTAASVKRCPRWCGWEYPGHVNDPKPSYADEFQIVQDGPIRRARCWKKRHDFNPHPTALKKPAPKPGLSALARNVKKGKGSR